MKQALFTICLLLVSSVSMQSCVDFADPKLVVTNNSNRKVYVTHSAQKEDKGKLPSFPPYSIDEHGNQAHISRRLDSLNEKILWPHTSGRFEVINDYWEDYLTSDSVTFFILNAAVVDSLNWQDIRSRDLYVKKFYLPLDSAKRLNWRITFN